MRIKTAREQALYTQESLAEAVGVSRTAVSRWERGEIRPGIANLILLAKTLKVSTDWLLGIEDQAFSERYALSAEADILLKNLIREIRNSKERGEPIE